VRNDRYLRRLLAERDATIVRQGNAILTQNGYIECQANTIRELHGVVERLPVWRDMMERSQAERDEALGALREHEQHWMSDVDVHGKRVSTR
jgi:hypothetical protein